MLSQPNRLSLRTDRIRLEKEGVTRHSPLFIVVSAPSSLAADAPPRFALLVSKKLAPLSVTRHRLKRLITEIIRLNLNQFPQGKDFLIIPKKNIFSSTHEQIISDLKQLCS
ncbi:MAG: ribonuclease P protein component [Patescibacteria group bacterium]